MNLGLKRSARTRPLVVLTGARQTGKTSTFLRLFPDYDFVSLELFEAKWAEVPVSGDAVNLDFVPFAMWWATTGLQRPR
jgi:hypothetical protein